MTTDTLLDAGPVVVRIRVEELPRVKEALTAARAIVLAVRDAGTCPGPLTPLVEALSLALGDGPLWGPAPVDTEAPRQS